jgi:hypothetical protein
MTVLPRCVIVYGDTSYRDLGDSSGGLCVAIDEPAILLRLERRSVAEQPRAQGFQRFDEMRRRWLIYTQKIIATHPNLAFMREKYHPGNVDKLLAFS